ncbi:hypothetical protein UO65_3447 [Actinokineospora spheciospongiae]|uniref:DUF2637 domain-containing protein n=1 Tax=Actinokineospora spheciospongiae TaxID=909613 RepID=W7IK83_9PSEU|nr:hypothetical protein [Actinokineospora spheciospongiae]EWC61260.1 hypothetical protein UO65_3447 [Actinokineospora spheciospongiae]
MNRAQELARSAAEAAEVRAHLAHPDVVALGIERVRRQVDWMCWSGIVLGLAFTMTNVQQFAAGSAAAWSLRWVAAWVLDPTVSLVLLAILRAEQVTARYRVATGAWVRRAKWFTLAATYVMNTWESFVARDVAAVVLHSVPPLVVFAAAEAITDLRDKLTEAVIAASAAGGPVVNAEVHEVGARSRKLFADYLADARAAWSPGVEVTPAWVREVSGCSRGLSSRLARALADEVRA